MMVNAMPLLKAIALYRQVSSGHETMALFTGEMVAPFKDSVYLDMVQSVYDQLTADITNTELAIAELYESGATL